MCSASVLLIRQVKKFPQFNFPPAISRKRPANGVDAPGLDYAPLMLVEYSQVKKGGLGQVPQKLKPFC